MNENASTGGTGCYKLSSLQMTLKWVEFLQKKVISSRAKWELEFEYFDFDFIVCTQFCSKLFDD